jgi:hypothetical protein
LARHFDVELMWCEKKETIGSCGFAES